MADCRHRRDCRDQPAEALVLKWRNEFRPELKSEGYARCTIELEPIARAVKLTIMIRSIAPGSKLIEVVSDGWPRILSNLLETEKIVLS
jgi:Activator of Hsp90 ATPase homolog 1-like protein